MVFFAPTKGSLLTYTKLIRASIRHERFLHVSEIGRALRPALPGGKTHTEAMQPPSVLPTAAGTSLTPFKAAASRCCGDDG